MSLARNLANLKPSTAGLIGAEDADTSLVQKFSFRNRIINGDMRIDQRNNGAQLTPTNAAPAYSVDRWSLSVSQNSICTIQRNAGGVTPPVGFTNYWGFTTTSALSIGSSDYFGLQQRIEGFNTADFGFGAAGATPVTVSFWVRSSLTGSFGLNLQNGGQTRSFATTYTINAANTWEYKTVTIPGDTSGTWATDNTTGIVLTFGLGIGSTFAIASSSSWQATSSPNGFGTTGTTSVVGTNGATFYITGVQLEKGSTATSFDYRPYGTELALCQRYYWQIYSAGATEFFFQGYMYSTTQLEGIVSFPVPMRAIPTVTSSPVSQFLLRIQGGTPGSVNGYAVSRGSGPVTEILIYTASNTVALTVGYGSSLISSGTTPTFIGFSAEL